MQRCTSTEKYYYEVTDVDDFEISIGDIAQDITVEPVSIYLGHSVYTGITNGIIQYQIQATVVNNSKVTDLTNLFVHFDEGDDAEILSEYGEWRQTASTLATGESVTFTWVISIDVLSNYPDGGAYSYIVYAGSDQTVTSSGQGSIAIEAVNGESNELDFGTDVWNFHNLSDKDYHTDTIIEDDKNVLFTGLSASECAIMEDFLETNGDGGHCFGMALTTILSKMNIFDISDYGTKLVGASYIPATYLREAEKTDRVKSILCYYQSLQNYSSFVSAVQEYRLKAYNYDIDAGEYTAKPEEEYEQGVAEQLTILAEKADKVKSGGTPVLFEFGCEGWGAHALVAYATETGSWKKQGVTYNKRILVYDCNSALAGLGAFNIIWDEDSCLYFNEGTDEWIIPNYYSDGIVSTNAGAYLKGATNDLTILNTKNYESSLYNYIAELRCQNETAMRIENSNNQYIIRGKSGSVMGNTDLATYYDAGYNNEESSIGTLNIILPDECDDYILSALSNEAEALDFYIGDDDIFLSVNATAATGAAFSVDGKLAIHGNTDSYKLKIASDNVNEGKYNTYIVSGNNTGDISFELTEDGILLSGDDLTDVTVIGGDKGEDAEVTFSTENDSVLVLSDEENAELVILVDTDDDGIYETILTDEEDLDKDITISNTENGTITVTPSDASEGDMVTIIVTPDAGYELSDLTVADEEGNEIELIDNGDGTYSFIMPAGSVTINADFAEKTQADSSNASGTNSSDSSAANSDSTSSTSVNTGDNTRIWLWVAVLLVGATGFITSIRVKKKL